jgi:hypothetical protein
MSVFKTSLEHTLPPTRLLTPMHENTPYCMYNCPLEDEPTRFETCSRHQELNINLERLCILLVCVV